VQIAKVCIEIDVNVSRKISSLMAGAVKKCTGDGDRMMGENIIIASSATTSEPDLQAVVGASPIDRTAGRHCTGS
jgi:hypothetical protein